MQNTLKLIFPDQCVACGTLTDGPRGLCGPCWLNTPFIEGLFCDACGLPLMGEAGGGRVLCDDCMTRPHPWARGRATLEYRDGARRLVLGLKHGDRLDLVRPISGWMAARGQEILTGNPCLVPVPLHWSRLFLRRFNQAAALSAEVARLCGGGTLPDALLRIRRTRPQERMTTDERRRNLDGAIVANPARRRLIEGRRVVLIDDVMTSGATLAASAEALTAAGAAEVSVLVLARVVKGGSGPI